MRFIATLTICFLLLVLVAQCFSAPVDPNQNTNPYKKWENGPSPEPDFFTIAVWLQNPANAKKYQAAGINTYIGLWEGPTEKQLADLKQAGMKVICRQNEVGLRHLDDPLIIGWMHGDEPDNAQSRGPGKGYGPPILPANIIADYQKIAAADPTRPVLLNLGQGVAWDNWHGRGTRTNHPEDYPEYIKGADIVSFDIYPVVHSKPAVSSKLWYVARGVERLVKWTDGKKPVWNCIECTHINNKNIKPTPHQVRSEVWMSLIHGSVGLIYFVHEWQPKFNESALLSDPQMLAAVTKINRRITSLAPVLNTPTIKTGLDISLDNNDVPVAAMMKKYKNSLYIFAVCMRDSPNQATFTLTNFTGTPNIKVLDENRSLKIQNGTFTDNFQPWDVHLYQIIQ
ncbi:MAG: hypothetical protein JXD22_06270 [Sedimentisphaerales bacterium]|nr:hypothetical protein [Sedimentisphaerales bacterium]